MTEPREYELEIFRADTAASKGITAADIAHVATTYDAAKNPAPLVKGHPEHDKPAVGVITAVRAEGNRLFAKVGNIAADVLQGIRDKAWINRSVAFWHPDHPSNPTPGKYSLRHLGLLGASTPAIAGMEPMKFNADETVIEVAGDPQPAVIFTVAPTSTVIIEEKTAVPDPIKVEETAEFKAEREAREAAERRVATFEAEAKKARERGNAEFVENLVKAGKLPPAHKADLITAFNALPTAELTFAAAEEGGEERKETPIAFFQRLFSATKPQVIFETVSPKGVKTGEGPDLSTSQGVTDAANAFIAAEKAAGRTVSFAAAVEHVSEGA